MNEQPEQDLEKKAGNRAEQLHAELSNLIPGFILPKDRGGLAAAKPLDTKGIASRGDHILVFKLNAGEPEVKLIAEHFTNPDIVIAMLERRLRVAQFLHDVLAEVARNYTDETEEQKVEKREILNTFISEKFSDKFIDVDTLFNYFSAVLGSDTTKVLRDDFVDLFQTSLRRIPVFRLFLQGLAANRIIIPLQLTILNNDIEPSVAERMRATSEQSSGVSPNIHGESYLLGTNIVASIHNPPDQLVTRHNYSQAEILAPIKSEADDEASIFSELILYFTNLINQTGAVHGGLKYSVYNSPDGLVIKNPRDHKFKYTPKFVMRIPVEGDINLYLMSVNNDISFLSELLADVQTTQKMRSLVHPDAINAAIKIVDKFIENIDEFFRNNPNLPIGNFNIRASLEDLRKNTRALKRY